MIINDSLIYYLQQVHSEASRQEVYWLEDPVIKRYEILREYAHGEFSAKKLRELAQRYAISAKTIKNYLEVKSKGGTLALFPEPLAGTCDLITSELEKKIVILHRGGQSSKEILTTLRAIDPTLKSNGFNGRYIKWVLKSHGFIPIEGLKNLNFQILQSLLSSFIKLSKKRRNRPSEEFNDPEDQIQQRLEMFRAVYYAQDNDKKSTKAAAKMCDFSKAQFFNIKKLFEDYGVLGLVSKIRGCQSKHKLKPEIETKIVQYKLSSPEITSQELLKWLVDNFHVHVTTLSINNVLSFWFGPRQLVYISLPQNGRGQKGRKVPHISSVEGESVLTCGEKKKEPVSHLYGLSFSVPQVEMLFVDIMEWLGQGNSIEISRPGLFIMAPYLRKLGIYECFETLVRKGYVSKRAFYAFILRAYPKNPNRPHQY